MILSAILAASLAPTAPASAAPGAGAPALPADLAVPAAPAQHEEGPAQQEEGAGEEADPAQEPEEKPLKKKFARLTSPQKKQLRHEIYVLVKEEDPEERAAAEKRLAAIGEGIVPEVIADAHRFEEVQRNHHLWAVLDVALQDDALHLAWEERRRKTPASVTRYLVRRWADAEHRDAEEFLRARLADEESDDWIRYPAARGLAWRGHDDVFPLIEEEVKERWNDDPARLRADFAGFERGRFGARIAELMRKTHPRDRLTGVRLFELFGTPERAQLLRSYLSESDTTLRLGGINACRVVLAGEEPLERPSMTQIIERAEAWKQRL